MMALTFDALNKMQGEQLKALAKLIAEQFHPQRIICFGDRVNRNVRRHRSAPAEIEHTADFCLLVIMPGTQRREHELQDYVNVHYKKGKATVLCHGGDTVRAALQQHNYFFATVLKGGLLLYTADGFVPKDELPEIDLKSFLDKAEKPFNARMANARCFFDSADHKIDKNRFALCVFMLHQAVEQALCALIYIHMGYRTDIHHIGRLLGLCSCITNDLDKVFFQKSEGKRLFRLLQRSYTEARYEPGFVVKEKDAIALYGMVKTILERAEVSGRSKIMRF